MERRFYESFVPREMHRGLGRRGIYSLRSTLPLCEMHRAAKLVRDLANQRWISTASTDFIFPSAPRPGFRRDERLRRGYRPSAGLRPLNVSRVKCGGLTLSLPLSATMYETYDMPTIRLYERIAEGLISTCRKYVVAATGSSPFKVRDNQRPERTMSGAAKTSA